MIRKMRGEFMLFITALIWGVSFVAQRSGMDYIGPFTFNGIRCFIGALVLLPVIITFDRQRRRRLSAENETKEAKSEKKAAKKNLSFVHRYRAYFGDLFKTESSSNPVVLRGIGNSRSVFALHQRRFFYRER